MPRAVFFRSVVLLAAVPLVWLVLTRTPRFRRDDWAFAALAAFAGVCLVTAFTGVAPTRSIYGDFGRMWGALTWLHLVLYYLLLRTTLDDDGWRHFLDGVVLVGGVVTILGLIQNYSYMVSVFAFGNLGGQASYRPHATLGNAGYLSAYLVLTGSITLVRTGQVVSTAARFSLWALLIAEIWLFLLIWGKATLVGIGIALVAGAGWYLVRGTGQRRLWALLPLMIVGVSAAVALRPEAALWRDVPIVRSIAASARIDHSRLELWRAALDAAGARPLRGWGIENAYVAMNSTILPSFSRFTNGTTIYDRVHNTYIEVFVGTGIVGLILFCAFFVATFFALGRARRRGAVTLHATLLIAGGLIAYLTYLFFWFEDWGSLPIAIAIAAFIGSRAEGTPLLTFGPPREVTTRSTMILTGTAIVCTVLFLHQWAVRPLMGARMGSAAVRAEPGVTKIDLFEGAISQAGIFGTTITSDLTFALRTAPRDTEAEQSLIADAAPGAFAATTADISRDPLNDILYAQRARILRSVIFADSSREIYDAAIQDAAQAITLAPTRLENYHLLAELQLFGRDPEGALRTLERARSLYDGLSVTERLAVRAALDAGQVEDAFHHALDALEKPGMVPFQLVLELSDRLREEGTPARAAELVESYLLDRYQAPPSSGAAPRLNIFRGFDRRMAARLPLDYARLGDREGARRTALLLREGAPDADPRVEDFLRDLAVENEAKWNLLQEIPLRDWRP